MSECNSSICLKILNREQSGPRYVRFPSNIMSWYIIYCAPRAIRPVVWQILSSSFHPSRYPLHRRPAGAQAFPLHAGPVYQRAAAVGTPKQPLWHGGHRATWEQTHLPHLLGSGPLPQGAQEVLPRGGEGHRWVHEADQGDNKTFRLFSPHLAQ